MGVYKVFDGTNWVDPCVCDVRIRTSDDAWKLLEPLDCATKYWDGATWCLIDCGTPQINDKTEINIWFDSSGSMESTLPALQAMKDDFLAPCLLPLYGGSQVLYDERVHIIEDGSERSIAQLGTLRNADGRAVDTSVTMVLNLVYSDEANNVYWSSPFDPNVQTAQFITDVTDTRNATLEAYTVKGTMFRVNGNAGQREFVEAQFVDNGLYTPPLNLSDLPFNYNANLDTEKGFVLFNNDLLTYRISNAIDWIPGSYLSDITTGSGTGAGMQVNIGAEQVLGGMVSMTITNPGLGYPVNQPALGLTLDILQTGSKGSLQCTTDAAGIITAAIININGRDYIPGQVYQLAYAGTAITAEVTIDSVASYVRADFPPGPNYPVDYGNGQYVSGDIITAAPPLGIGTSQIPLIISTSNGTPQYYTAGVVTALNQLGLVLNCP